MPKLVERGGEAGRAEGPEEVTGWLAYIAAVLTIMAVRWMLMARAAEEMDARLRELRDAASGVPRPVPPAEMPVARVVRR
jgi:hypothetical protein